MRWSYGRKTMAAFSCTRLELSIFNVQQGHRGTIEEQRGLFVGVFGASDPQTDKCTDRTTNRTANPQIYTSRGPQKAIPYSSAGRNWGRVMNLIRYVKYISLFIKKMIATKQIGKNKKTR